MVPTVRAASLGTALGLALGMWRAHRLSQILEASYTESQVQIPWKVEHLLFLSAPSLVYPVYSSFPPVLGYAPFLSIPFPHSFPSALHSEVHHLWTYPLPFGFNERHQHQIQR